MFEIKKLTDMEAAFDFYHRYSVALPREGKEQDGYPSSLGLMPVGEGTIRYWFAGEDRITFGAFEGGRLVGIASGSVSAERHVGYLSYICVVPDCRRRGLATALLEELEAALSARPEVEKLEVVFHNPVQLPWYVPYGNGDYHPCLPGVDKSSGLYLLLKNRGYRDYATQNCYYRRMADYADKPSIAATRERLLSEGIELTLFDPEKHHGLPELFDNMKKSFTRKDSRPVVYSRRAVIGTVTTP